MTAGGARYLFDVRKALGGTLSPREFMIVEACFKVHMSVAGCVETIEEQRASQP